MRGTTQCSLFRPLTTAVRRAEVSTAVDPSGQRVGVREKQNMHSALETAHQRVFPFAENQISVLIDQIVEDLTGRVVMVAGLGESGHAAALFLLSKGARVRVTDSSISESLNMRKRDLERFGAAVQLGGHTEDFCKGSEIVVVSPGVNPSSLPLVWADAKGVPVISEVELAFRFCRSRIVGITGTNGKTTTCELTNLILSEGGFRSAAVGNIGLPLVSKVAEQEAPDVLVVELSSFQLERIHKFRPFISGVLNITDDHLDRYSSFREYAEAKKRIVENQKRGDFLIVNEKIKHLFPSGNREDSLTVFTFGHSPQAHISFAEGKIVSRIRGHLDQGVPEEEDTFDVASWWHLRGEHNLENVAVAIGVAEILLGTPYRHGVPIKEAVYSVLSRFRAPDHRIQFVDEIRGVSFFDDSKGTNVDAAVRALESFQKPVVLIAGGRDKGGDYAPLLKAATGKVKMAVLIGEAQKKMMSSLSVAVPAIPADGMSAAVELAFENAIEGDIVLLSPACSSFDMFLDYKHRGKAFQRKVKKLKQHMEQKEEGHEAA